MGLFEPIHLVVILAIALVIFGPGKIGDLGATLGRSIRDFKKAMNEETPTAPAVQTATLLDAPTAQASAQPHEAPAGAAAKSPDAPASV
jgi:sec-independent protein translocase protein TatA